MDYAKAERRRDAFLLHCPDLVIVDEAHSCAQPAGRSISQQQRHELLVDLARQPERHLLLLTATPHSGVEESFRSLLGLLAPRFADWDLHTLTERQRADLARAFVQRRRADVLRWLGEETPFPERDPLEAPYSLSPAYRQLFDAVYAFAREIVRSGETLSGFRQRVRYWTALALLRCVMSSPAAAQAALEGRAARLEEADLGEDDSLFAPYVYDDAERETAVDIAPTTVVDVGEQTLADSERRRLHAFARQAAALYGAADTKATRAAELIADLLAAGHHPIVYCRYIATADYLAGELKARLAERWPDLHLIAVTGALTEDERQIRVAELSQSPRRILVATDCLSEGINLQDAFDAVVHYDLPWNPNRLEQREGRVDRYGQRAPQVKTVLLYGRDNPVDGAVLDVLLRKAVAIRKTLGISVPVPVESETVVEAVLRSLFLRGGETVAHQLSLFEAGGAELADVHRRWDAAVERERESRTRFAQHALKPEEVARELEESEAVLGSPQAVQRFVLAACQRLGAPLQPQGALWRLNVGALPVALQERLGGPAEWRLSFTSPAPEGAVYVGRNHPLTEALAELVFAAALDGAEKPAARCAALRTTAVMRRTTLLLLRIRFLLQEKSAVPTLAEECVVCGFRGRPEALEWLPEAEALDLLTTALPAANVTPEERTRWLMEVLAWTPAFTPELERFAAARAARLRESHQRVRRLTRESPLTVQAQVPADLLGIYVLMPVPQGVR